MNDSLIKLAKNLKELFNANEKKYIKRQKKTSLLEGVLFRMYYTEKGASKSTVTAKLNEYLKTNIHRSSYANRDNQIGLDLYKKGFRNVFWPHAMLTHYESKSVGSYKNIPPSDYDVSLIHYGPYLNSKDPFFNNNLDLLIEVPTLRVK